MNILEGFSKNEDLVEFICTKYGYSIWVSRFIVRQLEKIIYLMELIHQFHHNQIAKFMMVL